MRKEVRKSITPFVDVPVHHAARISSPELRRHAVPPRRDVRRLCRVPATSAALDGFGVSCASPRCLPRAEPSSRALDRVRRRASPPLAAGRRRRPTRPTAPPLARVLGRRIVIRWARSNPATSFARVPPQLLDLDPMDLDLVNLSQASQTPRWLWCFCRKAPEFSGIHKYTLPQRQNLYGLVLFLLF
jgi:hypothetical protein